MVDPDILVYVGKRLGVYAHVCHSEKFLALASRQEVSDAGVHGRTSKPLAHSASSLFISSFPKIHQLQPPQLHPTLDNTAMSSPKEKKSKKKGGDSNEPPLSAVERLQALNLVSRVASEWNNHLGISDRTLAEFVIDLAERRIKSFLKEHFVKESGSMYKLSVASDDGKVR
eukprot:scaffold6039_cov67-Skeletonema_dohrnii-CCMP3373.AAC.2